MLCFILGSFNVGKQVPVFLRDRERQEVHLGVSRIQGRHCVFVMLCLILGSFNVGKQVSVFLRDRVFLCS